MKTSTFKTTLATLLMLFGVSVGYAQTQLYERGTSNAWSEADIADWATVTAGATASITDNGLYFTAYNSAYENKKSISFTANSIATLNVTWMLGQSTGRNGGYNYLRFAGIEFRSYGQDKKATVVVGDVESNLAINGDDTRGGTMELSLTVNQATGEFNYTINGSVEGSGVTTTNPDGINIGYFKPGRIGDIYQTLSKIEVSEEVQSVQTAEYTIKFVTTGGTELKSETRTGVVGNNVNVTDADRSDLWLEGVKYIYQSDDAEGKLIAASGTVVTITFAEATKAQYTLTAIDDEGTELQQLQSGEVYEGEKAFHYYTKGIEKDGVWYMTAQKTSEPYYGISINGGENATVTYSASEACYFSEVEDLTPSRSWAADGIVPNRYANGVAKRLFANSYVKTAALPAGIYTLTLRARNNSSSTTGNLSIYLVDANGAIASSASSATFADWGTAEQAEKSAEGIIVPEGYAIALNNATSYNSNLEMDYLYLVKTGDPQIAQYTVKFVDTEGTELKSETRDGAVGVGVSLASTDKDPITITDDETGEETVYIYQSDDSEGKTIEAEGTVLTITFKAAEQIPYTITAIDANDTDLGVVAEGTITETLSKVVYYTKAIQSDGQWFTIEQNAADPYYGITVSAGENPTLTYTLNEEIDYFSEVENLRSSHSWAADGAFPGRYANGHAKRLYKNSYVTTDPLPAGKYTITLRARNNSRNEATLSVYTANGDRTLGMKSFGEFEKWGGAAQAEMTLENVNVPEGFRIAIVNTDADYNSNLEMDYVFAKRTGDYEVLLGDVNGDGDISLADALLIIDYTLTDVEPEGFIMANADMNNDNSISVADALGVIDIALGNE